MPARIIIALQSFHNPILDGFFSLVTQLGSEEFYVIVIALLFWCVSKRLAFRLSVVFLSGQLLNSMLKNWWRVARPIGQPGIRSLMTQTASGYSMPSGHSQGAGTFWGYLALRMRKRLLTIWSIAVMLLVGLSRVYLGVHWPQDVAVGLVLGVGAAFLFARLDDWWIKQQMSFAATMLIALVLPPVLLLFDRSPDAVKVVGFLMGLAPGYLMEQQRVDFVERRPLPQQIGKLCVGLIVLFSLKTGLKPLLPISLLADLVRYALIGLAAAWGLPYLFRRLHWG